MLLFYDSIDLYILKNKISFFVITFDGPVLEFLYSNVPVTPYSAPQSSFSIFALCSFCRNCLWGEKITQQLFFWRLSISAKVRFLHEVIFIWLQIKAWVFCSTRGRYKSVHKSYVLIIGPHPMVLAFGLLLSPLVHFLSWKILRWWETLQNLFRHN